MEKREQKFITVKDVEYVAKLARVHIPQQDEKMVQEQLERILEYVAKLRSVNTDNIPPTSHPHDVSNVWREDAAQPCKDLPDLFQNAPEMEETFYKVKRVIE